MQSHFRCDSTALLKWEEFEKNSDYPNFDESNGQVNSDLEVQREAFSTYGNAPPSDLSRKGPFPCHATST